MDQARGFYFDDLKSDDVLTATYWTFCGEAYTLLAQVTFLQFNNSALHLTAAAAMLSIMTYMAPMTIANDVRDSSQMEERFVITRALMGNLAVICPKWLLKNVVNRNLHYHINGHFKTVSGLNPSMFHFFVKMVTFNVWVRLVAQNFKGTFLKLHIQYLFYSMV